MTVRDLQRYNQTIPFKALRMQLALAGPPSAF